MKRKSNECLAYVAFLLGCKFSAIGSTYFSLGNRYGEAGNFEKMEEMYAKCDKALDVGNYYRNLYR